MSGEHINRIGLEKLDINDEIACTYKPPPEKSLDELISADTEDESLQKYKEKLLGEAKSNKIIIGNRRVRC